MKPRRVTLRYFDGCPNWKTADERVRQALNDTGLAGSVTITYERVDTPEEAERLGFIGSPTVLIDDADPWKAGGEPAGLSCRIYQTEDGPQGSPTRQQLAKALASPSE